MSLPLTFAGGSVDGISATLDLKFASSKSLTSSSGITPSFTRASSGTYFGSDGLLKYAPVNLALYSEQFDNAAYTKSQGSIVANQAVNPDGKTTADRFTASSGTVNPNAYQAVTTVASSVYTFSIYVKKDTHDFVQIVLNGVANGYANFDINSGTVGTVGAGGSATASIVNAGNGWFRCVIAYTTASTSGSGYINLIGSVTAGRGATFSASGTESVYLWGQQLETGSTPGTYVPTTSAANSAPRFDHVYDGANWISKGLLVEEQRTNYAKYANDLSTNWTNESGATREYNSIVSPDGTTNATKVNVAAIGYSGLYQYPLSNGGLAKYTYSVFAKKGTKDWLWSLNPSGSGPGTFFNLSNGTIGNVHPDFSASIVDCGNGWFRCVMVTLSNFSPTTFQFGFSDANNSVTPASTGYSYVYGAQIELGSFATSFIPNNTAGSVTRSADVCQIAGTDFSSFWNASEGSFAVEGDSVLNIGTGSSREYILVGAEKTSTSNDSVTIWKRNADGYSRSITLVGGAYTSELASPSVWADGATAKIGFGFRANDFASSFNGSAVSTDNSGAMPSGLEELAIGYLRSGGGSIGGFWCGHISRLRYFNKRLTNTQLVKLSK